MNKYTKLAIIAIVLIPFTWVNAEISKSVGSYQLDAAYTCNFTAAKCRGDWPNRIVISR